MVLLEVSSPDRPSVPRERVLGLGSVWNSRESLGFGARRYQESRLNWPENELGYKQVGEETSYRLQARMSDSNQMVKTPPSRRPEACALKVPSLPILILPSPCVHTQLPSFWDEWGEAEENLVTSLLSIRKNSAWRDHLSYQISLGVNWVRIHLKFSFLRGWELM